MTIFIKNVNFDPNFGVAHNEFLLGKDLFYLCNDDDHFGSFSVEIISEINQIKIGTIIFGRES